MSVRINQTSGQADDFLGLKDTMGVISMADYGRKNDASYDNTPAFIEALTDAKSNGGAVVFFPAGDWYFLTSIDIPNEADQTVFYNAHVRGVGSEYSWQLQIQYPGNQNHISRLIIKLSNDSDIWWDQKPSTVFGPQEWSDLTFWLNTKGSVFSLGDETDDATTSISCRGFMMRNCYGSYTNHQATSYLTNDGSGESTYVLTNTHTSFFIKANHAYDFVLHSVSIRGFKYGVILKHCDRPLLYNLRGGLVGKLIDMIPISTGQHGVPGHFTNIWSEGQYLYGFNIQAGLVSNMRVEAGYDSNYEPNVGQQVLPSGVEWDITAGDDTIEFSGTFPGSYDATDYFEPRSIVKLSPTTADEPDIYLYITAVTATSATFDNASTTSYVPRNLTGTGDGIARFFGTPAIFGGRNFSLFGWTIASNIDLSNFPIFFCVPKIMPIVISGDAGHQTANTNDSTTFPVVVASSSGNNNAFQSDVIWLDGINAPNHPLVSVGTIDQDFSSNTKEMLYDPITGVQTAKPGRGHYDDGTANLKTRLLTFRTRSDADLAENVFVYRISDASSGWKIGRLKRTGIGFAYTIRCYATTGTPTLTINGGAGTTNTHTLASGWNTINGIMLDSQIDTVFFRLIGSNIEVAWMRLNQNQGKNLAFTSTVAQSRTASQTAAVASVATYTVGAQDSSFMVCANVLVTTSTTHAFTATCAYTDEGNTARTLTLSFTLVAGGAFTTSVSDANGGVPYMGIPQYIRAKAGTSITIATTGTFTTVTYNVDGYIKQIV